ncbi:MAG: TRAP transporter small permease subunit [Deltaproteobacteria bacterium]|nr:TRAP transporter small permease subunit [Deltaproteobacteria bacterium]
MKNIVKVIEALNSLVGHILGWVALLMALAVVYEVVARYFFNAPTLWSMEINQFLFCTLSLLGGGYCLLEDKHVRVDLFYQHYSEKTRAIVEMCTFPIILILCVVLVYFGGREFWSALIEHKTSNSVMEFPLWPVWFTIPFAGFLLSIQVIARYLRHIMAMTDEE